MDGSAPVSRDLLTRTFTEDKRPRLSGLKLLIFHERLVRPPSEVKEGV